MYSFIYVRCPDFGQKEVRVQWLQTIGGPIWPLTFDPLIHIPPNFLDMQNHTFLNYLGDPINLSPILLKSNQFENLTHVQKVSDL